MSCIGLCGKGRIMIKVAFCDDDLSVLKELSVLMDRYRVERNQDITYAAFHSPLELLSEVERGTRLDIIFLDVLMPGQDGISAAREIRKYGSIVRFHHFVHITQDVRGVSALFCLVVDGILIAACKL